VPSAGGRRGLIRPVEEAVRQSEGFEVLFSCQDAESVPGRSAFGPSRPLRRIPLMVSFLTHSGHLAFAAGTALHAPNRSFTLRGTGPFVTRKDLRLPWQQEPGYRWASW
jgi:hypothetical protein